MKKTILFLAAACFFCTANADAKTLKFNRGSINPNQLHKELLDKFPAWRGDAQADGSFRNPALRVEMTASDILITVPDEAQDSVVQQAVAAHVPLSAWPPAPASRKTARTKLETLGFTDDEIDQILHR